MARSKAYRWGEEGIGGISDNKQHICFALAFWNHHDKILKERFLVLRETNPTTEKMSKKFITTKTLRLRILTKNVVQVSTGGISL